MDGAWRALRKGRSFSCIASEGGGGAGGLAALDEVLDHDGLEVDVDPERDHHHLHHTHTHTIARAGAMICT